MKRAHMALELLCDPNADVQSLKISRRTVCGDMQFGNGNWLCLRRHDHSQQSHASVQAVPHLSQG